MKNKFRLAISVLLVITQSFIVISCFMLPRSTHAFDSYFNNVNDPSLDEFVMSGFFEGAIVEGSIEDPVTSMDTRVSTQGLARAENNEPPCLGVQAFQDFGNEEGNIPSLDEFLMSTFFDGAIVKDSIEEPVTSMDTRVSTQSLARAENNEPPCLGVQAIQDVGDEEGVIRGVERPDNRRLNKRKRNSNTNKSEQPEKLRRIGIEKYSCYSCKKSLASRQSLCKHFLSMHDNAFSDITIDPTKKILTFNFDGARVDQDLGLACMHCNKKYFRQDLIRHLLTCKEKPRQRLKCNNTKDSQDHAEIIRQAHKKIDKYECYCCRKLFCAKSLLSIHYKKEHDIRIKRSERNVRAISFSHNGNTVTQDLSRSCPFCNVVLLRDAFLQHVKAGHCRGYLYEQNSKKKEGNAEIINFAYAKIDKYECCCCRRLFASKYVLCLHYKKEHGVRVEKDTHNEKAISFSYNGDTVTQDLSRSCPFCNVVLFRDNFLSHVKNGRCHGYPPGEHHANEKGLNFGS